MSQCAPSPGSGANGAETPAADDEDDLYEGDDEAYEDDEPLDVEEDIDEDEDDEDDRATTTWKRSPRTMNRRRRDHDDALWLEARDRAPRRRAATATKRAPVRRGR